MVVPITEFGDVLMQVAQRDFVALAYDATYQQPPESFDSVGVNLAAYVADFVID
jgi:hypothetical protein